MKKILTLLTAIMLCLGTRAHEQERKEHRRFNPQEFQQKLQNFINEKAEFTCEESQKFFHLFNEMKKKQRQLQKEIRKIKHSRENLDDQQMAEHVVKIAELESQSAELKTNYYREMAKVIPGKKLFKAILAEDGFHRQMLRRFASKGKP